MKKGDKLITIFEVKTGIVIAEIVGDYTATLQSISVSVDDNKDVILRVFHCSDLKLPVYLYTGEITYTKINFEDSKYYRMAKVVADTMDKSESIRHYAKMVG